MNDRETRRYEMFGRVITFGQNRAADFPAGSKAVAHFTALAKIVADLDAAKAAQRSTSVTAKEVLIDALRLDLQNISRTARAIAQDEPGFSDHYRMPDSPSQTALLTAVDALLARLRADPNDSAETKAAKEALVARFVAYALPSDFVDDLAADRATIAAAQDEHETSASASVASTASIGLLLREGLKHVNHLDAIVHNRFARQPEVLRAWESASHTERAPQRERRAANTAATAAGTTVPVGSTS